MSPIIPIAVLLLGGLGLAASKKKKPNTVDDIYRAAMDPNQKDLEWLRQAVAYLNSQGRADLAGQVSARIAAIQAQANADQAAREAAEQARQDWEQANGGAPTSSQLDAVWEKVQSGELDKPTLQYAWTLFVTYGTPERAAATQRAIDALSSVPAPPAAPPSVVVPPGGGATIVAPEPPTVVPPAPPPAVPPAEPPVSPPVPSPTVPPPPPPPAPITPAPPVQPPQPLPVEPQPPEVQPIQDPNGTIALARDLITAEGTANWKTRLKPQVKAWQQTMGTQAVGTADGLFGVKSAKGMALEVGVLPRVRYWPSGSQLRTALPAYQDDLFTIAANLDQQGKHEHAAALRVSANAETGQGYPSSPRAVPLQERADEAADVIAAVTAAAGENDLRELYATAPWLQP